MNKNTVRALTAVLILALVCFRFYRRYQRQQIKEKQQQEQQEFMNKQLQQTLKTQREQKEIEYQKALKRKSDSMAAIRRAEYEANMKKLQEAQKRLQEEIDKNKKKD